MCRADKLDSIFLVAKIDRDSVFYVLPAIKAQSENDLNVSPSIIPVPIKTDRFSLS